MTTAKKLSGLTLATAAAGMFALAPIAANAAEPGSVHCQGVNKCKGMTGCKTATNACAGQNACKGTGWVAMSKEACDAIGGKVEG